MSFFDFDDKESSFFTDDMNDNRAGEKRTMSYFDGDGDNSNSSDVHVKAPKLSKVDFNLVRILPLKKNHQSDKKIVMRT